MEEKRPDFNEITSYHQFHKFYWYQAELKQICKQLNINHVGNKPELLHNIEEYFKGNSIKKQVSYKNKKNIVANLTLDTKLVECGFRFNQKFRNFFAKATGKDPFKFHADMVATAKKVIQENDTTFTLNDMLAVYYRKKEYAKFDNSACQWNQFLKDFCADSTSKNYCNKVKVASILWHKVKNSSRPKIYFRDLLKMYHDLIKEYESKEDDLIKSSH